MGRPSYHYQCPSSKSESAYYDEPKPGPFIQNVYMRRDERWVSIGRMCRACLAFWPDARAVEYGHVAGEPASPSEAA